MDALLKLWIIGSVLVLAVVDRVNTKASNTTYASARDPFGRGVEAAATV